MCGAPAEVSAMTNCGNRAPRSKVHVTTLSSENPNTPSLLATDSGASRWAVSFSSTVQPSMRATSHLVPLIFEGGSRRWVTACASIFSRAHLSVCSTFCAFIEPATSTTAMGIKRLRRMIRILKISADARNLSFVHTRPLTLVNARWLTRDHNHHMQDSARRLTTQARHQVEARWPALLASLASGLLFYALPEYLTIGPGWLLFVIVAALLIPTT